MAYALTVYGEFAEDELERLARHLKPGMVAVDVGANIGTHATAFEQMVQPGGCVYAIEPHPCNFNILCGNVAMRATQYVFPLRAMAGSKDAMHILPLVDAESRANFGALHALGTSSDKGGIPTPEIRIDSIGLPRCDFIKIDVEGSELEVLHGAQETIAKYRPVIQAECLDTEDADASRERIEPFFKARDYRMFWLYSRLYRPNNFRGSKESKDGHDRNILAVPRDMPELTEGLEEVK